MTHEYGSSTRETSFEDDSSGSDAQGQDHSEGHCQGDGVAWRRRAKSLCDITWEPICILKFLSQDCVYCEKKVIVTGLKLHKLQLPSTNKPENHQTASNQNAIEILKTVQLKPGEELIRSENGSETRNPEDKNKDHVCVPSTDTQLDLGSIVIPVSIATLKPTATLPNWGILPPVEETEAEVEIEEEPEITKKEPEIIKPVGGLELGTKVLKTEVTKQTILKSEVRHKEVKLEVVFEVDSEDEKSKSSSSPEHTNILEFSSEANDEILTRAYEVINENDDLLTALDKLEHQPADDSHVLTENIIVTTNGNLTVTEAKDCVDSTNTLRETSEYITEVECVEKHRVDLKIDAEKRDEFRFIVHSHETVADGPIQSETCDTSSKLPKPVKTSTSGSKTDETAKSKVTKTNTVKQKEGNRLIRALNWVSKLPARISAEKQAKKQDHKHEKHGKQQDKLPEERVPYSKVPGDRVLQEKAPGESIHEERVPGERVPDKGVIQEPVKEVPVDHGPGEVARVPDGRVPGHEGEGERSEKKEDFGFFVKLNPGTLPERQNKETLEQLVRKGETVTDEPDSPEALVWNKEKIGTSAKTEDTRETSGKSDFVTEVLSSFQPNVDDTHFQDNLRRFHNISFRDQENGGGKARDPEDGHGDTFVDDDDWEPGPRQTGSLPNLAGAFLSTSPTMERIREYMMQDESDDSSLDEFLLIPMPTDFEQTGGSVSYTTTEQQEIKSNLSDVCDMEKNYSTADAITSPNRCTNLQSDADGKLPQAEPKMETLSSKEQIPISKESDITRLPRPVQGRTDGVSGIKTQPNVPITSSFRGGRSSGRGGGLPRPIRGSQNTPPYVTPPRPIRNAPQTGSGRGYNPRDASRVMTQLSTRGSGGKSPHATAQGTHVSGNFFQFASGDFDAENKYSVRDRTQAVRSPPPCPRLTRQPGGNHTGAAEGFSREQQHYIASHKPVNTHAIKPRSIPKGGTGGGSGRGSSCGGSTWVRPPGYGVRAGGRGRGAAGTGRGQAVQGFGRNTRTSPGTANRAGRLNLTPVLPSQPDPDQSQPPQVRVPEGTGEMQAAGCRVQAHITLLPGDTQTSNTSRSAHACSVKQLQLRHLSSPEVPAEVPPTKTGNGRESIQDGGGGVVAKNNWMDSGVQMDFTDEG